MPVLNYTRNLTHVLRFCIPSLAERTRSVDDSPMHKFMIPLKGPDFSPLIFFRTSNGIELIFRKKANILFKCPYLIFHSIQNDNNAWQARTHSYAN